MIRTIIPIPDRLRIARAIIVCHVTLIVVVVTLYISDSLLTQEFMPLLTLLTPVTSLYAGTVMRYLTERIKAGSEEKVDSSVTYTGLVRGLIIAHFIFMLALIMAKSVFNLIEFITTIYTAIQTRKGIHVEWWFYGPLTNLICKSKL